MSDELTARVGDLLDQAMATARTPDVRARLSEAATRLRGPLRLAIAGKVKAGKSTLLNAILGEELAPTDAGECTTIVTWYQLGHARTVTVHPRDGSPATGATWSRDDGAIEVDLAGRDADAIDHLEISWPSSRLRDLTILDTPGIASISADISERTHRVLAADDGRVPVADAVLYLMRHTHASDIRFLESFHDDELAHGTPMNSVGVLSRADEIGSCRLDAMQVAERIAERYQSDPRLRRLCPVIIAVDGLLAHASTSLREAEFAMLTRVARRPGSEPAELLLTVDRFVGPAGDLELTALEREHLLARLGLFGVRLGVELIRTGRVSTAGELAAAYAERSGLDRLRLTVLRQFEERSRVLKARSALAVLADVVRDDGCTGSGALAAAADQLTSGTHEFEEIRLLDSLRSGAVDLRRDRMTALDQVLGGSGHDPSSRLGLPDGVGPEEIRSAALESLAGWQRLAEHPYTSRGAQVAARTAIRTLEGLVAGSYPGDPP